MTDNYAWWKAALAGEKPGIHEGDPNAGYYKTKLVRGGHWIPVAIWWSIPKGAEKVPENERLFAKQGQKIVNPFDIWTRVCTKPITSEKYWQMVNGSEDFEARDRDALSKAPPVF